MEYIEPVVTEKHEFEYGDEKLLAHFDKSDNQKSDAEYKNETFNFEWWVTSWGISTENLTLWPLLLVTVKDEQKNWDNSKMIALSGVLGLSVIPCTNQNCRFFNQIIICNCEAFNWDLSERNSFWGNSEVWVLTTKYSIFVSISQNLDPSRFWFKNHRKKIFEKVIPSTGQAFDWDYDRRNQACF